MNQLRAIFIGLFVVNLFSLGFSLECPTCQDDECSQEDIPMVECTQETVKDLPDGLTVSYGNAITTFDCVSLKYTIGTDEHEVSQCVVVPIDGDGICYDIIDVVPPNLIIDDCNVRVIEVPIVETDEPTDPTEDPSTDEPSSTDENTTPTTTTECPECGAAYISLSIMCALVVLLRFTL